MTVKERITALREVMAEKKIDAFLVPPDDFHASEYVGEYFKCRKYITGFTGSAGNSARTTNSTGWTWTSSGTCSSSGRSPGAAPAGWAGDAG